ncbi:hypothetical protein BJX76DRAFT_319229 [Aspergillus varians]
MVITLAVGLDFRRRVAVGIKHLVLLAQCSACPPVKPLPTRITTPWYSVGLDGICAGLLEAWSQHLIALTDTKNDVVKHQGSSNVGHCLSVLGTVQNPLPIRSGRSGPAVVCGGIGRTSEMREQRCGNLTEYSVYLMSNNALVVIGQAWKAATGWGKSGYAPKCVKLIN